MKKLAAADDPVLREEAELVKDVADVSGLLYEMFESMYYRQGIGLAAPQIGVSLSVFVWDDRKGNVGAVINPLLQDPKGKQRDEEGCLSLPGVLGKVERPQQIVMTGIHPSGQVLKIRAAGLLARIFSHEYDHLKGRLITDRIKTKELHG